ncbi:MAG: hypothetical protein ABIV13_04275 [Fimbriimonadales bacterium]
MREVISELRRQAEESGSSEAFTPSTAMTAQEVATFFQKELPDVHMHFELCEDGIILTCDERCLGMVGTIKKDGKLTLTFPAGKNLEQVILSEVDFGDRAPVLEGAARFVRSRFEQGA